MNSEQTPDVANDNPIGAPAVTITVAGERPLVTFINVHSCQPEHQEELAGLLAEGAATVYRHLPGFVSASVHKSADGLRVTNYAQYRTRADLEAAWRSSAIPEFARRVAPLVESFDAHVYEIIAVVTATEKADGVVD